MSLEVRRNEIHVGRWKNPQELASKVTRTS